MAKIKIPSDVRREVYNQEVQRTVNKKAIYELANSQLNGMQAVGIWGERKYFPDEDYIFDGKHLKILPVLLLRKGKKEGETIKCRSGFYAVFDVNKCDLNSEITLKVPADRIRMFIGTKGWLTKMWCKKLGVKKINVVAL